MKKNVDKIFEPGENRLTSIFAFVSFLFTKPGAQLGQRVIKKALTRAGLLQEKTTDHNKWLAAKLDPKVLAKAYDDTMAFINDKPLISIIIPHATTHIARLPAALQAIQEQQYGHWEVLITCSPGETPPLPAAMSGNSHIRIISNVASDHLRDHINAALSGSAGEYILILPNCQVLTPNCLFEFVRYINLHPEENVVYCDDDIMEANGGFSSPYFKPNWSPDTLLSRNYIGNTFLIQKRLATRAVLLGSLANGGEYYDLLLRATELAGKAGHIPTVLHHHQGARPVTDDGGGAMALHHALARRSIPGTVTAIRDQPGCFRVKYSITSPGKVSIIIPTKDNVDLLKKAIDSVFEKTDYSDFEVILLNNNSRTNEFFALTKEYSTRYPGRFRSLDALFPFNFPRLINQGVRESTGEYVLMCNNDVEVLHSDWLTEMVSYAQQPRIGAVGVKLLYPDNTIQHAGIVLGINDDAGHVLTNMPSDTTGYFGCAIATTNYSAVTGACLMVRKQPLNSVRGMDESLPVEYNDLDLCLKLLQQGLYNVYLPTVVLYHHESASRGHPYRSKRAWQQHQHELNIFKQRWREVVSNDPCYNPNLSLENTDFRIKKI